MNANHAADPSYCRISISDDEIEYLYRHCIQSLRTCRISLCGKELWVPEKEKRKWLQRLGLQEDTE